MLKDYNPHNESCQGGIRMIRFDRLWKLMEERHLSTYYLREKSGVDSNVIRRLRNNESLETKTLDKLCRALDCKLEDIAEYVPDE